jgi:predicted nucleic acid-binding protein
MIAIDTNVLLRYLLQDDEKQAAKAGSWRKSAVARLQAMSVSACHSRYLETPQRHVIARLLIHLFTRLYHA